MGTVVEALTPCRETAACFVVQAAGRFGVMHFYGEDDGGRTPGFLPGEPIAWRINGRAAMAAPALIWADDRQLKHLVLHTSRQQPQKAYRLLLPFVLR